MDDSGSSDADPRAVLAGGGKMGALMRTVDWASTAVGPVEQWPQSLRTALSILMETGFPMYIAWGPDFTQFYNDGYRPILGSTKHPAAMGLSTRTTFAEIWEVIGPMFRGVMDGEATTLTDFMLPLDRHGFAEECYFKFSYSPIRKESGDVGGVLVTCNETTSRVLGERRLRTTQALADGTRGAANRQEASELATRSLATTPDDLPATRIYLVDPHSDSATFASESGRNDAELADVLALGDGQLADLLAAPPGTVFWFDDDALTPCILGPTVPAGGREVALAITPPGLARPTGILIATLSKTLVLDEAYCGFVLQVASQIGIALASAQALSDAKARADALAELDRAKTAFFSNVSHEFRTPLTLMIGPTEDALASPDRSLQGENLEAVHRNEMRLLKLVNTLLDFSRIEAGRVTARFERTDLGSFTAHLASAFRSATERVGLELSVQCEERAAPVFVDREMWEKIVLNLLSNAFKFTLSGSIQVSVTSDATHAQLRVRDTGTGIAAADVAKVFDRFYRIENTMARTHEGSGIGLALVHELVRLHGGTIDVKSTEGEGTTFTVRLPLGATHLPAELLVEPSTESHAVVAGSNSAPQAQLARHAYVEEALRWLPDTPGDLDEREHRDPETHVRLGRLLVADDNADMRGYLVRLLEPRFEVTAVQNGDEALQSVLEQAPDVLITDVMMPGLDGFELLERLRQRNATRNIPVIILSARAGEEARLEGLQAGADDYLVKPFSARELLARVDAQLVRSKLRALEEQSAVRLANVFSHAPVGVAILRGPQHVYEFANQIYLALVPDRALLGKGVREALPELDGQGIYELLDMVYSTGEPFVGRSIPITLQRPDATMDEIFVDFVYHPVRDEAQQVSGIAVVAFDVTELTKARREAEAANRAKDEFLAMLGHELRNPLAPIVTALQLMRLRQETGAERERTIIERQVKHMVGLVDDLLDVSRITRGQVTLRREMLDLADIVAKAIETTGPALEERRHALTVDVPRGLMVVGDESRLAQVLSNLLTNAAKYTNNGGNISIDGTRRNGSVQLTVTDSGRGISQEMLPRIFDLFAQERQEIDRSEGGLGLGLAIVKSLVQAHGGTARAHSAGKGQGAVFMIRLPAATANSPRTTPTGDHHAFPDLARDSRALRILIVDDNADAMDTLSDGLRVLGHETRRAKDGPSAVQEAASFVPHVVLLDLGLPIMDGYEVARRLRALSHLNGTELVALTGYGRDNDRARTRAAGFSKHLVKPVDMLALNQWLQSLSPADP